jgi:hypothetical protein
MPRAHAWLVNLRTPDIIAGEIVENLECFRTIWRNTRIFEGKTMGDIHVRISLKGLLLSVLNVS